MDKTSFTDFIALILDVWRHGVFGINIGQIMTAIGVFLFFLIIRRLFSRLVIGRFKALTHKTRNDIDDQVIEALENPLRFIPIILGVFFATEVLTLTPLLQEVAYNLNRSLVTFTLFWGFFTLVTPLSQSFSRIQQFFTLSMILWLAKALRAIIVFLGAAAILEIWGIAVAPLIAGMGLFGVAVALGAQDVFKNLIAGLFVIGEKRFHLGDWIKVDGIVEGTVEAIGFRTTTVRQFDKAPVFVPNAKLADNAVVNFSRMTHRRIYWTIGLIYDTTGDQLQQVRDRIESYIEHNPDFALPPDVSRFVRVDCFNDSSIDLMLYCFTRTTDWGEWLAIKEQLVLEVKNIVENVGTGFAFPSRSLYMENLPDTALTGTVPEK